MRSACFSSPGGLTVYRPATCLVNFYILVEAFLAHHRSRSFGSLATVLAINLLFIGYYLVFLPRFAEHASVYEQMRRFSTPMLFAKLLPAYGVFLPLPLLYAVAPDFRRLLKESPAARLMLIWLAVTAALVFHDRILFFMKPFQPMHFTRGYLFVPLVFFSTCALGWLRGRFNWSGRQFAIALTLIFAHNCPTT